MESWRDVLGYNGDYIVSDLGNVISLKRKTPTLRNKVVTGKNYYAVNLSLEGKVKQWEVHILVAMAFLGHVQCGHIIVVDHIDMDTLNNTLSNLQLITNRKNLSKDKVGTSKYTGVCWHKRDKKWRTSITINGKVTSLGNFNEELDASEAYQTKLKEINEKEYI